MFRLVSRFPEQIMVDVDSALVVRMCLVVVLFRFRHFPSRSLFDLELCPENRMPCLVSFDRHFVRIRLGCGFVNLSSTPCVQSTHTYPILSYLAALSSEVRASLARSEFRISNF